MNQQIYAVLVYNILNKNKTEQNVQFVKFYVSHDMLWCVRIRFESLISFTRNHRYMDQHFYIKENNFYILLPVTYVPHPSELFRDVLVVNLLNFR